MTDHQPGTAVIGGSQAGLAVGYYLKIPDVGKALAEMTSLTAWLPSFRQHWLIDCGPQPPPNTMEELPPERSTSGMSEAHAPTVWL